MTAPHRVWVSIFAADDPSGVRQRLEQAVAAAHEYAESGDVVTLSPACASFDMFKNFEERGKKFKEAVNRL